MPGPLDGVRVIDLGISIQGPWAGTLLGFLGADVIKIERGGDRVMQERPHQNGVATTYTSVNLNKRIAWLDLKDPALAATRRLMIQQADIILDNMRPGAVDRIGLGWQAARAINPAIVCGSSPGWGEQGPMAGQAAIDSHVQMFSGFAGMNASPGAQPEFVRYPHLDISGASYFACALLLGLIAKERTGQTLRLTASHLGAAVSLQTSRIAEFLATGQPVETMGSACAATAPNQMFRCQDLRWMAVSVETPAQWQGFCRAIQRPDLEHDSLYATNVDRVTHRTELAAVLETVFASKPARWWALRLEAAGVPFSYLLEFDDLRTHQQVVENGYFQTVDHPEQGQLFVGSTPWTFSKTPAAIKPVAPVSGRASEEVRRLGFGAGARRTALNGAVDAATASVDFPLAGVTVLESAQGYSGPFAALLLAEAGAEVIKIEPPEGDYSRHFAPRRPDGTAALFAALNRNKRSVVLDLYTDAGQARYRELAANADIVIEDWGPGVAASRRLAYEDLSADHPALVYCAISAWGEQGPLSHRPASELTLQAFSEFWRTVGPVDAPPCRVGADIGGIGTGVMAVNGILAAYFHRLRHGDGQRVAVSQLGTLLTLRTPQWAAYTNPDRWEGDTFSNSYVNGPKRGYKTKDRPIYPNLNNGTEEEFLNILTGLGMLEEALADERFMTDAGRHSIGLGKFNRELRPIWESHFAGHTAAEIVQLFNANGGSAVEQRYPHDILDHPQAQSLDLISRDDAGNEYLRAPWNGPWGRVPVTPPPGLGEHLVDVVGAAAGVS